MAVSRFEPFALFVVAFELPLEEDCAEAEVLLATKRLEEEVVDRDTLDEGEGGT